MIWDDIFKHYDILSDKLVEYQKNGFIRVAETPEGKKDYNQDDIEQLGQVCILLNAGFTHKDAKRYLNLNKNASLNDSARRQHSLLLLLS